MDEGRQLLPTGGGETWMNEGRELGCEEAGLIALLGLLKRERNPGNFRGEGEEVDMLVGQ